MQVYADNAATTRMSDKALAAMTPYFQDIYGNPSSLHTVGQRAAEALADARRRVADCLGCSFREITFTSGGSEADNQALRSAAAFGFDGVLLSKGCAAPFAPKTLRASMGAAGRLPVAPVQDLPQALQQLRARGVVCLAAALYHSRPLDEAPQSYPDGLCAVIGSEGQGLTDAAVQACDMAVRIPMTDLVESLNAGVAGSVLLWHFRGV